MRGLCLLALLCSALTLTLTLTHSHHNKNSKEAEKKFRILAFLPVPSKSHHRVWQPLLRELARRGHHVTYVTPVKLDDPPANFSHVYLGGDDQFIAKIMQKAEMDNEQTLKMRGFTQHFFLVRMMRRFGWALIDETLKHEAVQKLVASHLEFDAVIHEATFMQEGFAGLQHRFNAVTVEIETCGNWHWSYWIYGNPFDSNYIVDVSVPFTDRMSLIEKIQNTLNSWTTRLLWYWWYVPMYQDLMDRHLTYPGWESRPSMMDMVARTSLVLVNTHYSLNYPYPISPNVKEVGGLNLVPVKHLPKDLQEFMDGATDGVVYFTLGSYIQVSETLGHKLGPLFVKVFSKLRQRVMMKWETDYPDLPANIIIGKWFPQQDILAHKNIKLFISHGGFLSMTEAVNQGVPILGIPMLGDQSKNIRHVEYFEFGLGLEFENITEESLTWAIHQILNNPKYGENAKKRSQLFRDKPETALETAVYWTEYVIRHDGAHHLKPAIAGMPYYQQAMLDVYTTMALIVLVPFYCLIKITKCLLWRCGKTNTAPGQKVKRKRE